MSYSRSPRAERSTTIGTRGMRANLASHAPLKADAAHPGLVVAAARGLRHRLVDPAQVLFGELDVARAGVLLEALGAARARDRDDVVALREHPGQRQLGGRAALLARDVLDDAHELEVALEVRALEARVVAAEVVGGQVVDRLDRARQEAAPERRVGHEADAQLAHRREDLLLRIARPQGVLRL